MLSTKDLLDIIQKQGIDNIRFIVPMKQQGTLTPLGLMISSNDPDIPTECRISEEKYKVEDKYKISLTSVNSNWYTEDYYLLDLVSLIDKGVISIKLNEIRSRAL